MKGKLIKVTREPNAQRHSPALIATRRVPRGVSATDIGPIKCEEPTPSTQLNVFGQVKRLYIEPCT
jgi:hypothetical protein